MVSFGFGGLCQFTWLYSLRNIFLASIGNKCWCHPERKQKIVMLYFSLWVAFFLKIFLLFNWHGYEMRNNTRLPQFQYSAYLYVSHILKIAVASVSAISTCLA